MNATAPIFNTAMLTSLPPADRLIALSAIAPVLEQSMRDAVVELRSSGTTWQGIGELLSISKQAAQQRFGE